MYACMYNNNTLVSLCSCACVCVCVPGNAAKSRIALVRGHGLVMVQSLQSRAEQTSSSMQESLEAHYLAGLKRYGLKDGTQCNTALLSLFCVSVFD